MIQISKVGKSFERGGESLKILSDLDLEVQKGGYHALMGPSGSGKSTLLNLIADLDVFGDASTIHAWLKPV